ncbi:MAG TPA: MFS transporter [Streptosporangiaceae bacterium]|nr:MFS transporter [Streptosporangiaceae bacterium]
MRLVMDLTPLRRSRDLRLLVGGQLVSVLGSQMTGVAVAYQVYRMTGSSIDVGLVSLAQLVPLIIGALAGGAAADATDRRRLMLVTTALTAACSAGLAVNAGAAPALWPLYVLPALAAGLSGFFDAALQAVIPNLAGARDVPAANAMFQAVFQLGLVAGPSAAGLLLAGSGIRFVYWIDAASYGAALAAALFIAAQPPSGRTRPPRRAHLAGRTGLALWTGPARAAGRARREVPAGLRSITEGFGFIRGRQAVQGAYLIDLNATFFGLPRALFPALAATRFGGGAATVGFLYAAPGAGALLGALTTGWVGRVRRQGRAVIIAVIVWGLAIIGFGLASWLPAALALLAVAGWADVISAVYRSTIIQLSVPDALRGRLMGLQIAVVTGGPSLGDVEAGAVAAALGDTVSVVSGGLACIAGALVLARLLPGLRRQRAGDAPAVSGRRIASTSQ